MNKVAQNLKKLRTARGMTQDTLAEQLHVVRQTVSLWENGKREPDIETLVAIADALDCEVTELIYGPKPADTFAEGSMRRRKRIAVIFAAVFLLLLLLETLVKPPVVAILNSTYTLFPLRQFLVLFLPVLLYTAGGMAAVFSLAVFRDLRIRKPLLRIALLLFFLLTTGCYLCFLLFWTPPWYMRVFDFLIRRPILFLLPGAALAFACSR